MLEIKHVIASLFQVIIYAAVLEIPLQLHPAYLEACFQSLSLELCQILLFELFRKVKHVFLQF